MKQTNHDTLQAAIQQLPQYDPPPELWGEIERALDADAALADAAQNLPRYDPPPSVWQQIETRLSRQTRSGRTIRRQQWMPKNSKQRQWLAAAAAAGLLLTAWWYLHPDEPSGSRITHIRQEPVDAVVQAVIWEPEDAGFALLTDLCASRAPVCDEPAFQSLRSELDELTAAKDRLRSALGQYGDDPDLAAQLTKIERERSAVLRQLIQLI